MILLRRSEFGAWNTHNYRTCRVSNCNLYLEVNNILHQNSIQIVEHLSGNEYDCNNEHNTISYRKKRIKQKVKRMRQLSSTFFRRKREKLRQAKQHKPKSSESRQNNVQNQSNGSLIPLDGLDDGARKKKVKQKIDSVNNRDTDNPSFILTESKTDPAYLTMQRIIPQGGIKSQANKDNCFKTDIVQVHVNIEGHPEFKAESKYLTLDGTLPKDDIKMKRNRQSGDRSTFTENNKNNIVCITPDNTNVTDSSVLEDRYGDLRSDTGRKTTPSTNSDKRSEGIFMHESTSDMGSKNVTVDIESDLQSMKGQAKDSYNKFDEIRDLAIEVRERDSDETEKCFPSLRVEDEVDECSAHTDLNGEGLESQQLQGDQCKESKLDSICVCSAPTRHNIRKGSKSLKENGSEHKWKIKFRSEHVSSGTVIKVDQGEYENLRNWTTKYQDKDGYGKQFSCLPPQVSIDEAEGNNVGEATSTGKSEVDILNNQHFSKETIEQSDENCSTSKEVSTIKLQRQALRRKHNSEPGSSVPTKNAALSSQTAYRTKSESHDIRDKDRNNPTNYCLQELQYAETKDNSFENKDTFVDDIEKCTENQRPKIMSNGKNKYRKEAVRRKSPLEFKTSDDSGYASYASDRDRHVSEISNISMEIISEEECMDGR